MNDEDDVRALSVLRHVSTGRALAPSLWWFELRNLLIVNERRGRISESQTVAFLFFIEKLPIEIDRGPDETRLLALARKHRLTVYDAAYLELSLREGLPLATLDSKLERAAETEGLTVL